MATYVLIHDGFSGGWSWDRVAPLLRDAGHGVYAPSLIGLGERAHLATPEIGLRAQVADIAEMIEREDLHDVILVGHSYGGMVITGVAGEVPGRIAHLVYADAMMPRDGEAAANLIPRLIKRLRKQAKAAGGWRVPSRPEGGLRLLRAVMKQLSGRRNLIETRFAPEEPEAIKVLIARRVGRLLDTTVTNWLAPPPVRPRNSPGGPAGIGAVAKTIADRLGITVQELRKRYFRGASIAELGAANGVARDDLVNTAARIATQRIDTAVAATTTEAERGALATLVRAHIARLVDHHAGERMAESSRDLGRRLAQTPTA